MSPRRASRRLRGQSGVTLIEVLFVVGFSAALVVPIFALMFLTTSQFRPQTLANRSSSSLAIGRTNLVNDWSKGRVIRINADPNNPSGALPAAKMDCRGGTYPYYNGNVRPVIAIHTHASGNNTGRRIVYSLVTKPNGLKDLVRRECGHLPQIINVAPNVDLDFWADSCPNGGTDGDVCSMSASTASERVVLENIRDLRAQGGCNAGNNNPPYGACDAVITIVAEDGQTSSPRLNQPVVSTGRMVRGLAPLYVVYDTEGRRS